MVSLPPLLLRQLTGLVLLAVRQLSLSSSAEARSPAGLLYHLDWYYSPEQAGNLSSGLRNGGGLYRSTTNANTGAVQHCLAAAGGANANGGGQTLIVTSLNGTQRQVAGVVD